MRSLTKNPWAAVIAAALVASPAYGAGFSIFEQGSKAMGMAGAFTAQADDPSAMFHNAGGLAFQTDESQIMGGVTFIKPKSEFTGLNPYPGEGVTEEQADDLLFYPVHGYWVKPLSDTMVFGFGVTNPFGLTTEWDDTDNFSGRYIATRTELRTFDFNPTLAWQLSPRFGLGLGASARAADVQLDRRVPFYNPVSRQVQDIAKVTLESDFNWGYGFNAGALWKITDRLNIGLSYRSEVEIDFEGDGIFYQRSTGIPALDAQIAQMIPFEQDLPIETSVELPAVASLGLAYRLTPNSLVETDFNWTGWSSFDEIDIQFTENPEFSSRSPERYEDVYNYRIGFQWTSPRSNSAWRFGYVYDETPQPEGSVSPLLPDNDRDGFTIGYGHQGGVDFDLAFMYLDFGERTRDESFPDEDDPYFGTYDSTAYLLGLTLGL